jgi:MFS superfamily sulfate permease-like transporter
VVSASPEAVIITALSLTILLLWERPHLQKYRFFSMIPAPLVVVALGIVLNESFRALLTGFYLRAEDGHLVQLPNMQSPSLLLSQLHFPRFSALVDTHVYAIALTLAVVASLETLLSLEAVDKLDPYKRISDTNKELRAQGIGNIISGVLGGLPLTSVIVRSSANVYAGGKTRMSSIVHGVLLLVAVIVLAPLLNRIPLASLASILLVVGYKLTTPSLYKQMYRAGREQFFPFIITVAAIVFTDLLTGIAIGMCVGMFFVIRHNHQLAVTLENIDHNYLLCFTKDMTFINKNELKTKLGCIPNNVVLRIDGSKASFIDADIYDTVAEFAESAKNKNISIEYKNFEARQMTVVGEH